MLENVLLSVTFSIVTPASDAIYPYSGHTLIGKEKRTLVAHLSFLALSGKFQFGCMVPGCENRPYLCISGPQATLSKSLFDILCRSMEIRHAAGHFVWLESDPAPAVTL